MENVLHKATAFITRPGAKAVELLLFQHPHAGVQIPAGTVEPDETPEQCVLREAHEETGLSKLRIAGKIGSRAEVFPPEIRFVIHSTKVYSRPDIISAEHLAHIRPGSAWLRFLLSQIIAISTQILRQTPILQFQQAVYGSVQEVAVVRYHKDRTNKIR